MMRFTRPQKLGLALAVLLFAVQLVLTAGLFWRTYQGEKLVTMRTDAFEVVVLGAMQESYNAGRRSCSSRHQF